MNMLIHLDNLTEREVVPGYKGKFVHSKNMTLAYWNITAGAPLPEHSHYHEQVVNVLEGTLELTVKGETHVLTPGSVVVIPPDVPHSGKAQTHCKVIDVFYPVREDYKQ
jgi:quercetin dioxygenase-like cupin family protein